MFTRKDIENRSIFVINTINHDRKIRVNNGEFLLEEIHEDSVTTLTKFPFQKMLAVFIIGHMTLTTPLIDKCRQFNVSLVVMKPNLRPVFFWSEAAEANYLLRKRQYEFPVDDISIAKEIVRCKINNQISALIKTRRKDEVTESAIEQCRKELSIIDSVKDNDSLLGVEGQASKFFFSAYFQNYFWRSRRPRIKSDILNVTLDIGYTILFNFIESFLRMYGFDIYCGVYHKLWFKRKSLVCDIMEPFRCIVDHAILLAFNRKQFVAEDFILKKQEYYLKYEKCADYYKIFYDAIIPYKSDVFSYVQGYYRCFMGKKSATNYPHFDFK